MEFVIASEDRGEIPSKRQLRNRVEGFIAGLMATEFMQERCPKVLYPAVVVINATGPKEAHVHVRDAHNHGLCGFLATYKESKGWHSTTQNLPNILAANIIDNMGRCLSMRSSDPVTEEVEALKFS